MRVRPCTPLLFLWTLAAWISTSANSEVKGQAEAVRLSESFRRSSKAILPAVVTIRSVGASRGIVPPSQNLAEVGDDRSFDLVGAGVVIDADRGLVVTNDHVISATPSNLVVILSSGQERRVNQVWRDPKTDLAVLAIAPDRLSSATMVPAGKEPEIGDWVIAVGQPFGLQGTVTAGIISGKGRGVGLALYEDLLQTDAAINPGNSGGPLVNLDGEVVGINTAIKSNLGRFEGVGFAIPASRVRRVVDDLVAYGKVRRAYLGVTIRSVDLPTANRLGNSGAATISSVNVDGPASAAGIQPGDILLQVNDQSFSSLGDLQSIIEVVEILKPIDLLIERSGRRTHLTVIPAIQPELLAIPQRSFADPSLNLPETLLSPRITPPSDPEPFLEALPTKRLDGHLDDLPR